MMVLVAAACLCATLLGACTAAGSNQETPLQLEQPAQAPGMANGSMRVDVFVAGESGYYCIKIPDLVVAANGSLLAFGEARVGSCSDYTETHLVMKASHDGGATWGALSVIHQQAGHVIGNAAPVVLNTTRILLPHCRNNLDVFMTYSDDNGNSWSTPRQLSGLAVNGSKWIGLGPPGGLQLMGSGRVLIPAYYDNEGPHWDDGQLTHLYTVLSDDLGETWRIGAVYPDSEKGDQFANENQAVQLMNGTVLYNARTIGVERFQVLSFDGGETYSYPRLVKDLAQPVDGCEGSIVRAPGNDTLYFTLPTTTTLRYNLCLYESSDAGASWEQTMVIDKGPSGYTSLAFTPSGQLALLYERSNDLRVVFVPQAISFTVLK